jgi:hypothetical protein
LDFHRNFVALLHRLLENVSNALKIHVFRYLYEIPPNLGEIGVTQTNKAYFSKTRIFNEPKIAAISQTVWPQITLVTYRRTELVGL